jgi:hypothetical protein
MADLFNPTSSGWDAIDPDSSWAHLLTAVRCDPTDGNAWLGVWIGALSRADTALERRALDALVKNRFLTGPWLTHARWVLESAPPRAVLIANGDLDTYPPVALQVVQHVRSDVVVVNRNLLNLRWYAERLRDHFGLPLPDTPGADTALTASERIVRFWRARAAADEPSTPEPPVVITRAAARTAA